jgi:hypothetical protein
VRRDEPARGKGDWVEESALRERLEQLRTEHRDLDDAIVALLARHSIDQLQVARLKRRKLALRDEIAMVQDMLVPDIIA